MMKAKKPGLLRGLGKSLKNMRYLWKVVYKHPASGVDRWHDATAPIWFDECEEELKSCKKSYPWIEWSMVQTGIVGEKEPLIHRSTSDGNGLWVTRTAEIPKDMREKDSEYVRVYNDPSELGMRFIVVTREQYEKYWEGGRMKEGALNEILS